ncbi:MBL fold metallo-hydrolase [Pendulispora brunnea]|uniref:MBL fold metallo-hydrolase n=1 Tax=Pendulispora brunnea TaxID=2905690 RepID=A0ABZ2KQS5_9BACT
MTKHERITVDSDITPQFTACYLRIAGDECAFIEAHTAHALPKLLAALRTQGKKPEDVRWILVTHAHLDHAAGASALVAACPNAILLAHPRAARHLIDPEKLVQSATAVYGEERFRQLYGEIAPIPKERVRTLEDGESVPLGDATLTVFHTSGHANHHFIVDDPRLETVYTGDTFGVIYPALQKHGLFAIPSTSPTNFDAAAAKASIERVLSLGERYVCPTHFGPFENPPAIAPQLLRFVERAGAWVEEASRGDESLEQMTARLARAWENAIAEEAPAFGEAEKKHLALDVELNAQGLAFVANAQRAKRLAKT